MTAILLWLLLTGPPVIENTQMNIFHWRALVNSCQYYNVEPSFAYAVCFTESKFNPYMSGNRNTIIGYMGIHKDFAKKFKVDLFNPYENLAVGIRALQGKDYFYILKNYNKSLKSKRDPYFRRVMSVKKHAEKSLGIN